VGLPIEILLLFFKPCLMLLDAFSRLLALAATPMQILIDKSLIGPLVFPPIVLGLGEGSIFQ